MSGRLRPLMTGLMSARLSQPFLSCTAPTAWSFALNMKSTSDRDNDPWPVPINRVVSQVTKIGNQLVSVGAGEGRCWADSPASSAEGLGV
jgi:hypothetical protein